MAEDHDNIIIQPETRYIHLDVLRGFAVMGILVINIIAFAMPQNAYFGPNIYGGTDVTDIGTWFLSFTFFDGKMRGLFSLLFGASLMLIIRRSEAKGESSAKTHYNRMFWLMIIGVLHFSLIWFGDILFLYAVMGCFAYLMHHLEAKKLLRWALGIYISFALILSISLAGLLYQKHMAEQENATADQIESYQSFASEFDPNHTNITNEIQAYNSPYKDVVAYRITNEWTTPLISIIIGLTETFPFMLIGMALLKNGFFTGQSSAYIYRKAVAIGLVLGSIIYGLFAILIINSEFSIALIFNIMQGWSAIPRLMMVIGYAALIIMIVDKAANNALIIRIAAAGRTAFTNYIGTSIIMTSIFYGYGLGFFGQIERHQLPLFVLGSWILMLLWSKPWLMHFQYGPLEWLWRSLARREIQSFKRK